MTIGGDRNRGKRREPPSPGVGRGKKSKVCEPGGGLHSDGDDDFVSPPLVFLAGLQQDPLSNAHDYELTSKDDGKFPKVKTRVPSSVLDEALTEFMFVAWNHNVFFFFYYGFFFSIVFVLNLHECSETILGLRYHRVVPIAQQFTIRMRALLWSINVYTARRDFCAPQKKYLCTYATP